MKTSNKIPSRRNVELFLLLFSFTIIFFAYLLVDLGTRKNTFTDITTQLGLLCFLGTTFHIVIRLKAKYADPFILPIVTTINGLGLVMIHRIDVANLGNTNFSQVGSKQIIFTAFGIILAILTLIFILDHKILRRYTYVAMLASVFLLFMPLTPLGITIQGSRAWVNLWFITIQPAEFAKITLSIFFAGYLVSVQDNLVSSGGKIFGVQIPRIRHLGPLLLIWFSSIGILVLQRDMGSSVILFMVFVSMLYIATQKLSWIILGTVLAGLGILLSSQFFLHVSQRFTIWFEALNPEVYNATGGSYQLVQGLFSFANGGLFGTGLGQGYPNLIPYANSDFIVASLGEELGLFGVVAILLLFVILVERGFRAAAGTRDNFGKLLASGLIFSIVLQCFIVVGGLTRLIPLSGLTTPFMTAGGSSLIANWIIIALILRISDAARRPEEKANTGKLDVVAIASAPNVFAEAEDLFDTEISNTEFSNDEFSFETNIIEGRHE